MSRYNPHHSAEPVFEAAAHWRAVALVKSGSVFSDEHLWSLGNLQEVKAAFVDNPHEGEEAYLDKLSSQFIGASKAAIKLAAEMHWFMMLGPSQSSS